MKKGWVILVVAVGVLSSTITGHAALVTTTLQNVEIGTQIYDVTFSQNESGGTSFNDVFGSGSPSLTFTNQTDAYWAAVAVRNAGDAVDFDYTPANLQDPDTNGFILPYSFTEIDFSYYTGFSDDVSYDGVYGPFSGGYSRTALSYPIAFATFEPKQVVPIPGAV